MVGRTGAALTLLNMGIRKLFSGLFVEFRLHFKREPDIIHTLSSPYLNAGLFRLIKRSGN